MGGNGKLHKWKISIYRSPSPSPSSSKSKSKSEHKEPPTEYVCPISGSLMFDPVVASSGQTFESMCVQVCRHLGFAPLLLDDSNRDFFIVIPNLNLKSTILNWWDSSRTEHPRLPNYSSVETTVHGLMASTREDDNDSKIRVFERELLKGVAENSHVLFLYATTELNHRANHFYSSSSKESVIANVQSTPLLPFMARPMCFSPSSTLNSSEIAANETLNPNSIFEDKEFIVKLKSLDVFDQEQGLIALRKLTRMKEETRVWG
ncbi:U-box domain-containing protein 38-like [Camellia sinensis]|uniref:U-box domain-containing protein 38-like n=1 Tax=Camellia sinensis TaxID=4442 RepID=UPI001035951F|nr:U-box domain-containing protein 38-like [Camellia sinensis]